VDVSSGVESSRGVKDVGMIRTFIQTVNQGDVVRSTQK
jgi:phosphoribosylanthranilate isomerase